MKAPLPQVEDFYIFKFGAMWRYFKAQHFSFWMICCYFVFEFVRPQALIPAIDVIPFAKLFILASMVGAFLDPSVKWVSNIANKLIVLFFITILISIWFANYPDISKSYFMDFFGWFVIYFLIINIVNTRERFYLFLIIYLLAAGKIAFGTSKIWAFRGFTFTSWGLMGPKGYFQNSGELAILMVMLFPLAYYLYDSLKEKANKWEKLLLISLCVCPILTILGASSRGSQVALACQFAFIFRKSLVKPKALVGVVILCLAVFALLPQEQKDRFSSTGDDKSSQQRILYWTHGWEMMKQYPFAGVGYFNFAPYFESHFPQDMLYEAAQLPHNIFIQVGTDAGFFALFLFGGLIAYTILTAFFLARRSELNALPPWSAIAAGLGVGAVGFLIAGQFVTVGYYPFLWIHLALVASFSGVMHAEKILR